MTIKFNIVLDYLLLLLPNIIKNQYHFLLSQRLNFLTQI
jgi:hypothetical protein